MPDLFRTTIEAAINYIDFWTGQCTGLPGGTPATGRTQVLHATGCAEVDGVANGLPAQAGRFGNLFEFETLLVEDDNLFAFFEENSEQEKQIQKDISSTMANNIKISIVSALNAAGIEATKKQIDQMAKSVNGSLSDLAKNNKTHMADIKAGWDMACAAIKKAWEGVTAALKEAFKFETTTTQFKTLIGNIDDAKRHMKDLKDLGDTPPFSLDEFAKASRQLMVMTDGVLGYKEGRPRGRDEELVGRTK